VFAPRDLFPAPATWEERNRNRAGPKEARLKAAPTLQPGDHISHYRVVGPLGAGGMGEVYLAQDRSLDRSVALKVLPPDLVRSEERVRRFVLEAKSASSLNHPNIVTIYEIGQERVGSGDGSPSADAPPVHFISMELVTGKTLSSLIHDEKTDLRTLLGYMAQVAEGLAKAHAAGIVHRDLKPGNIMVTPDGFAKVLDFGLAKLTERPESEPDSTTAGTIAADATGEGMLIGTAGYMSPEQVRGKPADHRSDVFSFGCVLFEAATGRRPFAAESSVETMHRILNDKPAPIEELNPRVPAEVRRLVRRCLAKNAEQRYQSMKDLAIELRDIVDEYDTLSSSGSSVHSGSVVTAQAPPARRTSLIAAIVGALAIGVTGIAIGILGILRGSQHPGAAMRTTAVTSRGDVNAVVISPDGRYIAHVSGPAGRQGIWVRQVATGSDVLVVPPRADLSFGPAFSPDGNYLYYLQLDPEHPGYRALFQIPALGGSPVKKVYDIDSPISFAPDGKHACFRRGVPTRHEEHLVALDLEDGTERVVATIPAPVAIRSAPVWSPRGDRIAIAEVDPRRTNRSEIALYRVSDGRRETLARATWPAIGSLAWTPSGRELIVCATDLAATTGNQIFLASVPDGHVRKITNDVNNYFAAAVSADGKTMVALRTGRISNLWVAPVADAGEARPITTASNSETSVQFYTVTESGTIVFTTVRDGSLRFSAIAPDGSGEHPLDSGRGSVFAFRETKDGFVVQQLGEDMVSHIVHMDVDGGGLRPLTSSSNEVLLATNRDHTLIAYSPREQPHELWVMSHDGSDPRRVASDFDNGAVFSPDGSRLLYDALRMVGGRPVFTSQVVSISGAPDSLPPLPPQAQDVKWAPDSQALTFIDQADSSWNVYRRPLAGRVPEPVTRLRDGRTLFHGWSPDGRHLLLGRLSGQQGNMWLASPDGTVQRPLTRFQTGRVFSSNWARDSRSVVFTYGESPTDVVLIRDFE